MSRLGKKPITIPEKTEVSSVNGLVRVKGPLGELSREFKTDISIKVEGSEVKLEPVRKNLETLALWGTYAAHVLNMVNGVNKAFQKKLIVEGVGFKSEVKGEELVLNLGFSHQIKVKIPKTLKVTAEKNVITVSGIDRELVGSFAANVRANKPPEPYKGKGIRYDNEVVRRKQGKKTV